MTVMAPGAVGSKLFVWLTCMKPAFYQPLSDGRVLCALCPQDCRIAEGALGACAVCYNRQGKRDTPVYDKLVAREAGPIEKKPLCHCHPGSYAYSIATVGCNLRCRFWQNWQISQWPEDHLGRQIDPQAAGVPIPSAVTGGAVGEVADT